MNENLSPETRALIRAQLTRRRFLAGAGAGVLERDQEVEVNERARGGLSPARPSTKADGSPPSSMGSEPRGFR